MARVTVFTLGGTISARGGDAARMSGQEVLAELGGDHDIVLNDFRRVPSSTLTHADLAALAAEIRATVAAGSGVVVVQGTDTLEETAFLLDLLCTTEQPIAVTGAMRRPDLPGADGPAVPLYRPTREEIAAHDPSLTTAIETRRSIRGYGDQEMTARQLGEFLYRVARVRAHYTPEPGSDRDEVVSRPYPSGGQGYELELYVTVRRCAGLAPGIYYYDPVGHRLVLRNEEEADRESLFHVASRATGMEARPDVLVTVTARFQRMSWKYRAIAYATTLRHTGVLYQTMYLVATALGLAPCALGNGDADMSARVLGLDYLQESSVGDFLLGSRRPDDSVAGEPGEGWQMLNSPEWSLPENP